MTGRRSSAAEWPRPEKGDRLKLWFVETYDALDEGLDDASFRDIR